MLASHAAIINAAADALRAGALERWETDELQDTIDMHLAAIAAVCAGAWPLAELVAVAGSDSEVHV